MSGDRSFVVNGVEVRVDGLHPTTTLLRWLRATGRVGTKEGCAEGDCGACTVLVGDPTTGRWRAVNSCLVPVPSLAGHQVVTVEGLARGDQLHPAQAAMVDTLGSQCGYCTPGFVMSLAEACHRPELAEGAPGRAWKLDDQVCGNLCRCTGYRPIRDALSRVAGTSPDDGLEVALRELPAVELEGEGGLWSAPTRLEDAIAFLAAHPEARTIAGATDLGLDITQRHARFPALLSVDRIGELAGVTVVDGTLSIGAATRLSDLEDTSERLLPVLHRMLRFFGARQIKHRATIGGNLCNASPIGDLAPVVLALGGVLELAGPGGAREVPASEFFVGYRRTALRPGELLVRVRLPLPPATTKLGAYKVSRRRELDISAVSAAFSVDVVDGSVRSARLAFGGMAATPARATAAEQGLVGSVWGPAAVAAAASAIEAGFTPLTDLRATAAYRIRLARELWLGFVDETASSSFVALPDRPTATVLEVS